MPKLTAAAITAAHKHNLTTILYDEDFDRSWTGTIYAERRVRAAQFQRAIARIRARAVEDATIAGDPELAAELADPQFRDFRRTCVVTMGQRGIPDHLISAVTGHKLDTVKKILETYLPCTTGMAMLAVDLTNERAPAQVAWMIRKQ